MATDAKNEHPADQPDVSTIALEPEANQAKTPLDATCDLEPETNEAPLGDLPTIAIEPEAEAAKPADTIGAATCDLEPEPAGARLNVAATLAFDPSAKPGPIGDATCDIEPAAPAPLAYGAATCDIDSAQLGAETQRRANFELNTNSIPKYAGGETSAKSVVNDTQAKSAGRQTSQRAVGEFTSPGLPSDGANQSTQERAGRYVFKKFHAKGGMGEVWLCEDSDIGRPVALKRMLKGRQKHQGQFVKEAQVTGQLEHPGVIPVHELSVDENGQPYYVMKFVHGQTLKDVIHDFHEQKPDADTPREVAWLRLMNVFIDLCQTMAYAHSRGVIHRDIKPDNVMVGAYGETLVLDWGLAKVISEPESDDPYASIQVGDFADTKASMSGSIKGTPFYFAPEVASGDVEKVDHVSDVFLLGGTLYEMVTGRPPRKADKMPALLQMARTVTPLPPRQIDPTVPKPLDAICRKALAMKKEDRYQSATDLAEDMQRYLAGEPVSAYQETLVERTWRSVKKHRTALSRTAGAAVILAIGLTAFELIRDANARSAAATAEAAILQEKDKARLDIKAFRSLMEEARYYAASADPVAENVPALDAGKVEVKAKEALEIADTWGPKLENMPLEDQREGLKKDLYDLLLEVAQLKSRNAGLEQVKEVQGLLERAASFQKPTQSYYRLRARTYDVLGQETLAGADRKQEADPKTATSAMDHYLIGEQHRVDSLKRTTDDLSAGKLAGIKGLLARRESLDKAITAYRQALQSDPNHFWSHFQIGTCYSGLGMYGEAAEALGACIVLRPDVPWGYSARGLALVLSGVKSRLPDAEADLNQALRLDPEFRPARLHRAAAYAKQEKYHEAEADFALLLAPPQEKRMREAAFTRGMMYLDRAAQGKINNVALERELIDKALADFDDVVAGGLNIRAVNLFRTRIYLYKQQPEKALASLTLFLAADAAFDPESSQAYEQRGRELRVLAYEFGESNRNRREEIYLLAMEQLQQAIKKGAESASVYDEIGTIEQKLAELQPKLAAARVNAAIAAYGNGIQYAPKDQKLLVKRGWALVSLGNIKDAKRDFLKAVDIDAAHAESHTGLGYVEALSNAPASARRQAALATLHGAGDYLVLHNVACIFGALSGTDKLRAKENQDLALDHLSRAVELWIKGGRNLPKMRNIIDDESETTFPKDLRDRPEFKKIRQNAE